MFSRRTEWPLTRNRLSAAIEETRTSGKTILDLTLSNPTRAGLRYESSAILGALSDPQFLEYDPQPRGLPHARAAIAEYYGERGADLDPESLILTTGSSEAYSFVFRLLANPGEEILVAKPSYPLFDFLADLQDVKLAPCSLIYDHGWQIDFHALEQAVTSTSRALVLVHPNNPTGSYVKPEERDRLNELCARKNLALIVDEVFLDYAHDGKTRRSFTSNGAVLTFTLSGLSKISALPQMKLGWIAVSGPKAQRRVALDRLEVIADTFLSVSTPVQGAARVLLEQRKTIQPQLGERISRNLAELDVQLSRQTVCSRLDVEGGWYTVLRIPVTRSDEETGIELLTGCGVLVHPGHFYDFPQEGWIVLSLITPGNEFGEGISRLLDFFNP
jgi:alanine-synthesizing transaminase